MSPVEIDAALKQVAGVEDAAVFVEDDGLLGSRISAFLVLGKSHAGLRKNDLMTALAARLAAIKIPKEFYALEKLPRTTNGKLQRSLLKTAKQKARKL